MGLDEVISERCPLCHEDHDAKFFSLFVGELHYVIGDCTHCGYRMEVELPEFGSGLHETGSAEPLIMENFKKREPFEPMKGISR